MHAVVTPFPTGSSANDTGNNTIGNSSRRARSGQISYRHYHKYRSDRSMSLLISYYSDPLNLEMNGLDDFIDEITKLVEDGERQYGVANANYAEYFVERLELSVTSCIELRDRIQGHEESHESADLQDYCITLNQLIESLRRLFYKWVEYEDLVRSLPERSLSYQAPVLRRRFGKSVQEDQYLISAKSN